MKYIWWKHVSYQYSNKGAYYLLFTVYSIGVFSSYICPDSLKNVMTYRHSSRMCGMIPPNQYDTESNKQQIPLSNFIGSQGIDSTLNPAYQIVINKI